MTLEEGFHGTLAQLNGQEEFIVYLQRQLGKIVASAPSAGARGRPALEEGGGGD